MRILTASFSKMKSWLKRKDKPLPPLSPDATPAEKNRDTFLRQREEWLKFHSECFVLLHDGKFIGVYDKAQRALADGLRLFQDDKFEAYELKKGSHEKWKKFRVVVEQH